MAEISSPSDFQYIESIKSLATERFLTKTGSINQPKVFMGISEYICLYLDISYFCISNHQLSHSLETNLVIHLNLLRFMGNETLPPKLLETA